jgi:hypothetical protein
MKSHRIHKNIWYIRNKFLVRTVTPEGNIFSVYNKFSNQQPEDFSFETKDLKSFSETLKIFEEDLNLPIVEDLPDYYEPIEE